LLVFDKFHIVQHLSRSVDQVRRHEIREEGAQHCALMGHAPHLWLKTPWNLTERQRVRLSELERFNVKNNRAYLLRKAFRSFLEIRARSPSVDSTRSLVLAGHPLPAATHARICLGAA
jgi:transposase